MKISLGIRSAKYAPLLHARPIYGHGLLTPLPIYAAEYNMRFHVQSAGISLLGETIHRRIYRAAGNHRYANYLRGTARERRETMKGDDKFDIARKNGSLTRG